MDRLLKLATLFEKQAKKEEEKGKDPDAAVRNRGAHVVFPHDSKHVKDDKDHYPMNTKEETLAAVAYANKQTETGKSPEWFDGSAAEFQKIIMEKAEKRNKENDWNINFSDKAYNLGKG